MNAACLPSSLILTMRWPFIFLIINFTKWEYQPKECSGPSAHSRENLLEIFVLLLLSLPQLIHSCVTCMCVSLCQPICQKRWTPIHLLKICFAQKMAEQRHGSSAQKMTDTVSRLGCSKNGRDRQTDRQTDFTVIYKWDYIWIFDYLIYHFRAALWPTKPTCGFRFAIVHIK